MDESFAFDGANTDLTTCKASPPELSLDKVHQVSFTGVLK